MTKLGVAVAFLAIALGPLYTDPSYDWVRNTVSELAAQNTRNAWIMQVGLFALGAGLVFDFLRHRSRADLPFAAFGVFVGLSALFPHRPYVAGRVFSESVDQFHTVFSSLTGFSAVVGMVVRLIVHPAPRAKAVYAGIAAAFTILSAMMAIVPVAEGVFQRAIFGTFFVWAFVDFPWRGAVDRVPE